MTIWDVERIFAYWRVAPPTHELVAAYLGYKPRPEPVAVAASADDPSGIGSMILQFPDGLVKPN
ncbi:hypothetical protein FF100_33650 [Methylobacterium terricola]|uniref:Uncharacterized protein n=1 Tax=Methylobacterium terricola TaxID=2583531 RepID=A0A5C4L628_9HYPH|nr:hypothetical protein [Methylobacterium terricola]TNC07117.1 hypothetical protein FF100_33650 [Methylobacterium terricola]